MNNDTAIDLLVIGGGINGAGIARDAAGRGLSVLLCEKGDLAEGTSSRSGKLIHGGLRYLEYFEFRLVREALIEREVLLQSAPHIVWPMRFVLPHSPQDRPAWLIRTGLFLYDHLGGRKILPPARGLKLPQCIEGEALLAEYSKGFEYSDCWVDDSRLVVLNAMDAHHLGAQIQTRTVVQSAERVGDSWAVTLIDQAGHSRVVRARALVNAAGPWVSQVLDTIADTSSSRSVRLVKGSHIVVKKFWQGDHAYLLQNADKRVIFVNPYESDYALIGTTDIPHETSPESAVVEESEIEYLLDTVNRYFKSKLTTKGVVHAFSGVRPLYDDNSDNPSAVTRDYVFDVDDADGEAPVLTVFGGKITTFRKLSEHLVDLLGAYFENMEPAWTQSAVLPGGDFDGADFQAFIQSIYQQYPWLDSATADQLARSYGTRIHLLIGDAESLRGMGKRFSATFFEREALYLIEHEWALSTEDILSRRTRHGLHMTETETGRFLQWWRSRARVKGTSMQSTKSLEGTLNES